MSLWAGPQAPWRDKERLSWVSQFAEETWQREFAAIIVVPNTKSLMSIGLDTEKILKPGGYVGHMQLGRRRWPLVALTDSLQCVSVTRGTWEPTVARVHLGQVSSLEAPRGVAAEDQ